MNITVKSMGLNIQVKLHIKDDDNQDTDKETIVFLHYGSGNLSMWEPCTAYFEDNYDLVFIDLRGHGKSDKPDPNEYRYHIEDMATDVFEVMDHLDVKQAHIIGSSMGAEVGLVVASRQTERALSLICEGALYSEFGPYGLINDPGVFKKHVKSVIDNYSSRPELEADSMEELIRLVQVQYESSNLWNPHFERIERYGAYKNKNGKYISGMSKAILLDYMKHYFEYKFEDYYSQITCPVLMMACDHSDLTEQVKKENHILNRLCDLTKHCQFVTIPGWQHAYGWLLKTKEASETAHSFISSVEPT